MDHIETYSQEAKCWCGKNVIGVAGEGGVYACPMRHESFIPPCPRCSNLTVEGLAKGIDKRLREKTGQNVWGGMPILTPYLIAETVLDYIREGK